MLGRSSEITQQWDFAHLQFNIGVVPLATPTFISSGHKPWCCRAHINGVWLHAQPHWMAHQRYSTSTWLHNHLWDCTTSPIPIQGDSLIPQWLHYLRSMSPIFSQVAMLVTPQSMTSGLFSTWLMVESGISWILSMTGRTCLCESAPWRTIPLGPTLSYPITNYSQEIQWLAGSGTSRLLVGNTW